MNWAHPYPQGVSHSPAAGETKRERERERDREKGERRDRRNKIKYSGKLNMEKFSKHYAEF